MVMSDRMRTPSPPPSLSPSPTKRPKLQVDAAARAEAEAVAELKALAAERGAVVARHKHCGLVRASRGKLAKAKAVAEEAQVALDAFLAEAASQRKQFPEILAAAGDAERRAKEALDAASLELAVAKKGLVRAKSSVKLEAKQAAAVGGCSC